MNCCLINVYFDIIIVIMNGQGTVIGLHINRTRANNIVVTLKYINITSRSRVSIISRAARFVMIMDR